MPVMEPAPVAPPRPPEPEPGRSRRRRRRRRPRLRPPPRAPSPPPRWRPRSRRRRPPPRERPAASSSARRRRRRQCPGRRRGGGGADGSTGQQQRGGRRRRCVVRRIRWIAELVGDAIARRPPRCLCGRASERCWRRHRPQRAARCSPTELPAYLKAVSSPAGLRPAVSPAGAAPAPSPSAADYHSCLPGVATRPGRGGGSGGAARSRRQRVRVSSQTILRTEAAQAGVSTSGAVPRRGARRAAASRRRHRHRQAGSASRAAPRLRDAGGDGGDSIPSTACARVGPFECTTYRRFSSFLELHRSLGRCPRRRGLPRSRPPRNEQPQIRRTSTPRGESGCSKSTSTSCAWCPRRARAEPPPSSGPRPATARSSRPTVEGTLF